ncbi:DUF2064 domain-containing protein [Mangrovivirga cuniculi]|uniref:DUF2064 domain-containing protein n=1 Tax=Mangrovivirga cuniculi TaxID=2715131 RepID=UPI001586BFEB|nr:DUF2064 domain-containing protein [Mangrovivirga cuniculi]
MNYFSDNTAILFFSRTPKSESAVRIVHENRSKNRQVVGLLIESIKTKLISTGLPVYQYDESKQIGNNFSERLTNSIDDLFLKGYENVITVGSDSPELLNLDFSLVKSELEKGNAVLGPTQRGGTYLIAVPFKFWKKNEFSEIPWNTSRVFEALKDLYPDCIVKSELTEIHTYTDIIDLIKTGFENNLVLQLKRLLNPDYFQTYHTAYTPSENLFVFSERGPPQSASLHF